jgi:hypothetical protein
MIRGMKYLIGITALALPIVTHAQTIQSLAFNFLRILERVVIPFIIVIAFLFFIWHAFRFFIVGGSSDEGQKKAKQLMAWGIFGLVMMFIFLGLIKLTLGTVGLYSPRAVCPDYNPTCNQRAPSGGSFFTPNNPKTPEQLEFERLNEISRQLIDDPEYRAPDPMPDRR